MSTTKTTTPKLSVPELKKTVKQSLKLKELYLQSNVDRELEELQYDVDSAKLQLDSDVITTSKALNQAKKEHLNALSRKPFSPETVINAENEVEEFERGLAKLKKLYLLF